MSSPEGIIEYNQGCAELREIDLKLMSYFSIYGRILLDEDPEKLKEYRKGCIETGKTDPQFGINYALWAYLAFQDVKGKNTEELTKLMNEKDPVLTYVALAEFKKVLEQRQKEVTPQMLEKITELTKLKATAIANIAQTTISQIETYRKDLFTSPEIK